jgi:putative hydrolase
MDPVAALDEIAYWLERERATKYKSKAFRAASGIIAAYSVDELREMLASGRLKSTKGIGDTTFTVISEALGGGVPEYLQRLRGTVEPEPTEGGAIRAATQGDLHSHSDWSDGTTAFQLMARTARDLGHSYLALTDHSPRLRVANGLDEARLHQQISEVREFNAEIGDGFTLLTGIEVDILDDGSLDQTENLLSKLDVVVVSAHSKLKMESSAMTRRLVGAVSNPHADVLGHVTGRLIEGDRGKRPQSTFDARAVFEACAANRVAVEINSRPERQDPPDELIALALELGCLFSIDSDAHAPGHLGFIDLGCARAERLGVPVDRIVTTWPTARLLEWTNREK